VGDAVLARTPGARRVNRDTPLTRQSVATVGVEELVEGAPETRAMVQRLLGNFLQACVESAVPQSARGRGEPERKLTMSRSARL
jgi:hypothetical protein